jgi:hypothetical protein
MKKEKVDKKIKEFTVNLDVRIYGKDKKDVIKKLNKLMKNNKYYMWKIISSWFLDYKL